MNDLKLMGICYSIANLSDDELLEQQKFCLYYPYETIRVKCFGIKVRVELNVYKVALKLEVDKRGV